MRLPLRLLALLVLPAACADAPITDDQLEADGLLRGSPAAARDQANFSVDRAAPQRAAFVQLSAVLAAEAEGAVQDRERFAADVGTVHLHVRADGIDSARPVTFRWIHGDQATVLAGTIGGASTLEHASSVDIAPHQVGPWRVEVAAETVHGEPPEVLYTREFVVE
ncbi:MAG: hypothetical protein IPH07_17050 [Deltaproteobacteria bacterium]|nr:hypothetical protein [Deltaproteobacteria bacterium]MBK8239475.1 hypothetical protein [Deltaproteobacteria bacterium]MBK8719272.1 hypothetical protein [Deltaproteobacteria bacterium]MBP7289970.1 hypothetical protein [Nannocystaceae bacterium]